MKILATIFYTLFIALVVGIAGLLLGTMLPIPGNIEVKIVKSGSMEPEIGTGSLVVVKPAVVYKKGDIITFGKDTKSDIPTTHRIIAVNANGTFVTKGDANEEQDTQPIARSEVIGKVLISIPGAGYVLDFARTKLGFMLLIGIPAGLVILEEILTITRETQKWYRGRRGGRDGGGGGVAAEEREALDLRTHLKRVCEKRRAMDEIKVAMYVEPRWYEGKWWRKKLGLDTDVYQTSTSLTLGLVFFAMMFAGGSGSTLSYFQDLETSVGNIFRAGTWAAVADPQNVVLNEFLPNPDESANGLNFGKDSDNMPLGEWVELYNNGNVAIDIKDWYLADESGGAGNTQAVVGLTNTQPATTTIPAHGWLVIYFNKPVLNNTGDSIFLYTDGGVLVDSYTYDNPSDFCENEPTPKNTNASSTPSGSGSSSPCTSNSVAPNKSYARIPDGTGPFVDPIPTPGEPNIPDPPLEDKSLTGQTPPLPDPVMTDDLIDEEAGEVLGVENTNESGGGGGGGSGEPIEDTPEEEAPPVDETADTDTPPEDPAATPETEEEVSEPENASTEGEVPSDASSGTAGEDESPQSSTFEAIPPPADPAPEPLPEPPPSDPEPTPELPAEPPVAE